MEIEKLKIWTAIGGLIFFLLWESAYPFFSFFRKRIQERGWHVLMNLVIGLVNILMTTVLFVGLWWWAAEKTGEYDFGLLNWFNLPLGLQLIGALLIMDFWTYWWHVINHKVPFFWRFHQVHHSDRKMDVTTASRFHIGEIFFSSLFRVGIICIGGITLWELFVYEVCLNLVIQFHHANIGLPHWLDRFLRIFIVTPAMHKVHHSNLQPETDSNYTSLLSIWDRLFRTFRLRADPKTIQFGLRQVDEKVAGDLVKTVGLPFIRKKEIENKEEIG